VPRKEDARLVAGRGRYSDDFSLPGQAQAQLVRSPHAHARVLRIDVTAALAVPGVIAVLTGKDAEADGLTPIPHTPVPTNPNEFPAGRPRRLEHLRRPASRARHGRLRASWESRWPW
jgi:carbon-monoxide dehydrogenase large subunit